MEAKRTHVLAAVAILLAAAVVLPGASAGDPEPVYPHPIQPGAPFIQGEYWCTFDFVFQDAQGALYIGAAAHCTGAEGSRVRVPDVGEIGTVVARLHDYSGAVALGVGSTPDSHYQDFSLVRIDEALYDLVDPAVRFWGGPTGVHAELVPPGTPILNYGQGTDISAPSLGRPRAGELMLVYEGTSFTNGVGFDGWFLAQELQTGGDSGGPVLTADGRALGTVIALAATFGEPGWLAGPTVGLILDDLSAIGYDLDLVTAPFLTDDPGAFADTVAAELINCTENLQGGPMSQACLRDRRPHPEQVNDVAVLDAADAPDEAPEDHDQRHTGVYRAANVVAVETPEGLVGISLGSVNTPAPIRIREEASHVTVRLVDAIAPDVFFAVCVHTGGDQLLCSEDLDTDTIRRGTNEVVVEGPFPADTWVGITPYGLYVGLDGTVAVGTTGSVEVLVTYVA